MNNSERELWIINDEGLYSWWQSTRMSVRQFIREHRDEIDANITAAMAPPQPKTWRDYC